MACVSLFSIFQAIPMANRLLFSLFQAITLAQEKGEALKPEEMEVLQMERQEKVNRVCVQ